MSKGLSAVIVAIILLLISIALAGSYYLWSKGAAGGLASSVEDRFKKDVAFGSADLSIVNVASSAGKAEITVQNSGKVNLNVSKFIIYRDGQPIAHQAVDEFGKPTVVASIGPSQIAILSVDGSPLKCQTFRVTGEFDISDDHIYRDDGTCVFGVIQEEPQQEPEPEQQTEPESNFDPDSGGTLSDNIRNYWPFEEGVGSFTDDKIVSARLNFMNGPIWTSGIKGNGINFDGTNDYLSGNGTGMTPHKFSVFAWMKSDNIAGFGGVVKRGSTAGIRGHNGFQLRHANSKLQAVFYNGTDVEHVINGATALSSGAWYHVGLTYDNTTLRMYLNGALEKSSTIIGPPDWTGGETDINVGRLESSGGVAYFDGIIDEVGIWDRALTNAEISDLYNNGKGNTYSP